MAKTERALERWSDVAQSAFPSRDGEADGSPPPRAGDAALYLAHTREGASLRALARVSGLHASSVLRAVRRIEDRRDDPLFDGLIAAAAPAAPETKAAAAPPASKVDPADLRRAAKRFLRRLSEPDAFLLVKPDVPKGGIFCAANGHAKPIAMMPVRTAAEFLRQEWIALGERGAVALRYRITEVGRRTLKRILAEDQARKTAAEGRGAGQSPFLVQHQLEGERLFAGEEGAPVAKPVNLGESPLGWLARRKGPDGRPFLDPLEVEAGERLRDDFEAAQMGPRVAQNWQAFLAPRGQGWSGSGQGEGPAAARARVSAALAALGPGLSDVAVRVCCFLEGLESCERRMGWSARSGKVVLKLALQRLASHYGRVP